MLPCEESAVGRGDWQTGRYCGFTRCGRREVDSWPMAAGWGGVGTTLQDL